MSLTNSGFTIILALCVVGAWLLVDLFLSKR